MPFVLWHGLRLRRQWSGVPGAVGMFSGASIPDRTTYTVTAWSSEVDLGRWLRSPQHVRLMRDYKAYLESSAAVNWLSDAFEPRAAWAEGMSRLNAWGVSMANIG